MVSAMISLFIMAAPAPPGTLVDVGGYRVHLYCTGAGNPTVMIIGGFSLAWSLVQPEVARFTRVCTYDPSGTAWSDPGPAHPTCDARVDEIHHLLEAANVPKPYVLAGFSTGALLARLYAKAHPGDVAGMVIVDHAFLPPKPPPPPLAGGPDSGPTVISTVPVAFGVEDEPGFDKLPQSIRDLERWAESISPGRPTAEMAEACFGEVGAAGLGDLPLAVVSTANDAPGYAELQAQLLALAGHSRHFIASHSFHSIEISQPEVVIEAIRSVIQEARK